MQSRSARPPGKDDKLKPRNGQSIRTVLQHVSLHTAVQVADLGNGCVYPTQIVRIDLHEVPLYDAAPAGDLGKRGIHPTQFVHTAVQNVPYEAAAPVAHL